MPFKKTLGFFFCDRKAKMNTASCLWLHPFVLLFVLAPLCQVSSQHHLQRPQWFHQSKRFLYHQFRQQLFHLESAT